jgi:hypothetical protein
MAKNKKLPDKKHKKKSKVLLGVFLTELIILAILFGSYNIYVYIREGKSIPGFHSDIKDEDDTKNLSKKELEMKQEQEKLQKELETMKELVAQADILALGYDYDGAIELIKGFKGSAGGYQLYTYLVDAIERLEKEKSTLTLFGGSYNSVFEISHLYFNPLIADVTKAFDGDGDAKGYNMYNITVMEFQKMLQSLYDQGYVLIRMSDIAEKQIQEDGTVKYVPNKIYLREGKKPIIISENDVTYHKYMQDDGIASRIILDESGNLVCEMQQADGTVLTGAYDMVPVVDDFVKKHPDFSYKGAKGLLTLTGYDGIFGYRTNDKASPTYEADKEAAGRVASALKEDGWELGSHSWGYKDMKAGDTELLKRDTLRWQEEVGTLIGPTDIYVFPFGNDIESASGTYKGEKYQFLKSSGFNIFLGVYKEPWLHVKSNYVRMTRRPVDGQALLEFPDRLADLFKVDEIIDSRRPAKNW